MKCFETLLPFASPSPLRRPWEGSSNVCSVKSGEASWSWVLGLQIPWCSHELTCWWEEPGVQNTPLCLVTGSCGHMAGWCGDVIFPLAIADLPCCDNGHPAAEHQVTVTDQNAATLAVLGAFCNVDALSGQSTWWLIVRWSCCQSNMCG